jgi:hypothetical protein
MSITDWAEWIQALAGFGVLVVAVWAGRVAITQLRIGATTDLFHRFNDPEARTQRRWVYHHCRDLTSPDKLSEWARSPGDLAYLEAVCNSLDWAGLLVRKGLLKKEDAIDLYGDSLVRSWVILCRWICHTRDMRSSPKWLWQHFEWLAQQAVQDSRFESWRSDGVPIYTPSEIITLDFASSTIEGVSPLL